MFAIDFDNLHQILRGIYAEMIEYAGPIIGVAKGIAGLGALFYVAYRVWQQLSRAEPIDVFPLLRPLAIGIAIMFFPTIVLGTINGVMSPVVRGAHQMLQTQTLDIKEFSTQKDKLEREAMLRNPEKAFLVDKEAFDERLDELGAFDAVDKLGLHVERAAYNMKKMAQDWFRELLELLFMAAALVIDTIRTFFLVVLSILGPLSFAISVWDGFHSTLTQWIGRYLTVYLWLPVADIFSSILARIQVLMLQHDIDRLTDPNFLPDGSSTLYIIFMIIGIVGYFCVPTVAGWIVQAGGLGQYNRNIGQMAAKASGTAGAVAGNIAGRLLGR
jgi:conjugative transposon TraJ protein